MIQYFTTLFFVLYAILEPCKYTKQMQNKNGQNNRRGYNKRIVKAKLIMIGLSCVGYMVLLLMGNHLSFIVFTMMLLCMLISLYDMKKL